MSAKKLIPSTSGSVLPLVALMFLLLLLVVGIVIDIGRLYAVQTKAQNASDAALLGAAATASTTDPTLEMQRLFNADYPANYMGGTVSDITVTQPNTGVYQANFTVTVPTIIMQAFGAQASTLNILSQVNGGFQSSPGSLELALVLDNTDSMGNIIDSTGTTKIQALQQAASSLVDILFANNATLDNVHVSVIPYNIVVQIGTGHSNWFQNVSYESSNNPQFYDCYPNCLTRTSQFKYLNFVDGVGDPPGFKGFAMNRMDDYLCGPYDFIVNNPAIPAHTNPAVTCPSPPDTCYYPNTETGVTTSGPCSCTPQPAQYVPEQPPYQSTWSEANCVDNGTNDVDDTPPTSGTPYLFRVPNETQLYFGPSWGEDFTYPETLAPLMFASNVKADLQSEINSMQQGGDTRIPVGLMWGWFTLSPKWQGVFDAGKANLPSPFVTGLNKSLVLMTDGVNDLDVINEKTIDDDKTIALCNAIKAQGITIYTIGFSSTGEYNPTLLKNCASMPTYFFEAPTAAQLQTVFHQIGDDIVYNTIHLSQ